MGGDTAQLQRLTDDQVSKRLAAYNAGGSLDRDLQLLHRNVGDLIEAEVNDQFGPDGSFDRCRRIMPARSTPTGSRTSPNTDAASSARSHPFPNILLRATSCRPASSRASSSGSAPTRMSYGNVSAPFSA